MRKDIENRGGVPPDDELPERAREADREKLLRELISIPRLEIFKETEEFFEVKLGKEKFRVAKSSETSFLAAGTAGTHLAQRLEIRQVTLPDANIFQDEEAPKEFREVMILHEIREMEYKEAGFQDAHERAMQDEALYIIKHFGPDLQQAYLEFARKYRKTKQESTGKEQKFGAAFDEGKVDQMWHYFHQPGPDWVKGYLEQERPSKIVLSKLRGEIQKTISDRDKEAAGTKDRKFYEDLFITQQRFLKIFQDYLTEHNLKES